MNDWLTNTVLYHTLATEYYSVSLEEIADLISSCWFFSYVPATNGFENEMVSEVILQHSGYSNQKNYFFIRVLCYTTQGGTFSYSET